VSQEFANPAPQTESAPPLSRVSALASAALDSFSFLFFCLSFSSLTHLLGSLWSRLLAEE
jgi:hypothetical protein